MTNDNDRADRLGREFVTVAEVARVLRVSKMTIYRLVHSGQLEVVKIGRQFRIRLTDARTLIGEGDKPR